MFVFRLLPGLFALLAVVSALPHAVAAEKIAEAHRIINQVSGSGAAGNRAISTTDPVYRSEQVSAAAASRGELLLLDNSRVIVGENSTISMDDFVVAGNSFREGTIRVAKGAFRYISGGAREAISIRTPLSTIGIRGTVFDIYVGAGGATRVVVLSGSVEACTLTGRCLRTRRSCDILEITGPNQIQALPFLRSAARSRNDEANEFPLTEQQQRHSQRWRAFEGGCFQRAAAEQARPEGDPDRAVAPQPNSEPPDTDEEEDEHEECGECD